MCSASGKKKKTTIKYPLMYTSVDTHLYFPPKTNEPFVNSFKQEHNRKLTSLGEQFLNEWIQFQSSEEKKLN